MKINKRNKKLDLSKTLYSGQTPTFIFKQKNNEHYGYLKEEERYKPIKIQEKKNILKTKTKASKSSIIELLDLNRDLESVYKKIKTDDFISRSIEKFEGMRITKFSPLLTILLFISFSNNSIYNIQNFLQNLSKKFGKKIEFEGEIIYLPPSNQELFNLTEQDFRDCKAGYRAEYMAETFDLIKKEVVELEELENMNHLELKEELKKLCGVGDKVADCISLFAYRNLEAFPVDTHIKDIMTKKYLPKTSDLNQIREYAKQKWNGLAGYAQQYLYMNKISQI
ncbi:hypothetical protein C9439_04285 [archaeon SCG-AAA382B04]|nr:hypothetical protein C9439_04285 [archaeon SCG-AAA382B04]